jgi:putative glutamine amidotransferase
MSRLQPLLIGLSPRILRDIPPVLGFRGKTLQYLEQSIAHWAMAQGALTVMIPTVQHDGLVRRTALDVDDYAQSLDGLILQGGADLDPALYSAAAHPELGAVDRQRDLYEMALFRAFAAVGKPVLGVCRGMQLINVACGGSLHQDLQACGITSRPHFVASAYDQHEHALHIQADSWFSQLHGGVTEAWINSIHHQAVDRLGSGLVAEAWSDDGVIEVLRGEPSAAAAGGFIAGVQWHPEFHDGRNPRLLDAAPLMDAMLHAARLRKYL